MTFFSNQLSGRSVARSLGCLGLRVVSMGEPDQVVDVVVEVEGAGGQRHVARVHPVGDVDVMLGQHLLDRAAQQRREMPRHRGDDQHLGVVAPLASDALEVQQVAEGQGVGHLLLDRDLAAVHLGLDDLEFGLAVAPRGVDEHLERGGRGARGKGHRGRVERIAKRLLTHLRRRAPGRDCGVRNFIGVVEHPCVPDNFRLIRLVPEKLSSLRAANKLFRSRTTTPQTGAGEGAARDCGLTGARSCGTRPVL